MSESSIADLARAVVEQAASTPAGERFVLGVAGPPGIGKSTLARELRDEIGHAAVVAPMDGFHLDNRTLAARGIADRKGAPHTFAADAFADVLCRVKHTRDRIGWPAYDRDRHEPTPDGVDIVPGVAIVLVEGNYLLLDEGAWPAARRCIDAVWFLDGDRGIIADRLLLRHMRGGRSETEARAKISANDLPNAELVLSTRHAADLVLRRVGDRYERSSAL